MEEMFSILNSIPSPYSDLVAVAVIFIIIAAISFLIAFLFGRKAPEQIEEVVEPPEEIAEDLPSTVEIVESKEIIEPAPGQEFQTQAPEIAEGISETEILPEQEEAIVEEIEEETEEEIEPREEVDESKEGLFAKLRRGLSKTQAGLLGGLGGIVSKKEIDANLWDEFEETLIMADIGVSTTMKLRENIETKLSKQSLNSPESITDTLKEEILEILKSAQGAPINANASPFVIMVAGVNGVGKTTTIGKLANRLKTEDKKVMVAAGDT
ncbi:MAG: signal recognition particle receptor subunit alpha, partial [Thermodesulfobacteriales bacterium]